MPVVKNLMIRIGADFSAAKKGMQEATGELTRFKRDTERTTSAISGKRGLGGIGAEFKKASSSVSSSLSQIRGSKGLGGVATGLLALRPAAGAATSALEGVGLVATGLGRALGPVGIGLAVVTAALGVATVAIYKASQPAVKFEADLGRLNMQLKGGAKDFMAWSRAQGLAKTTSAELGSTFSVILSSFISDSKQLVDSTKQISQATRVLASNTGKPIEEVLERVRSGLLGNTEAIEDLGVFVNVAMIESTKAFKQFAGSKSWDQLDFRVQQQIRLAAILEQTYARYGNTLQNNTMTKQERLMEQLKDIKLNLSQAFLPIWDSVLPALTALTSKVAGITETIARFFYRLKGWDYDALTKGTDTQTGAVEGQQGAYDDLAKSAKAARKELAAFDQINTIGEAGNGSSSGGSGGSGLGTGGNSPGPSSNNGSGLDFKFPPIPPELLKRYQLKFDPPDPPDAGAGGVATAVINTINGLIADSKAKLSPLWGELKTEWHAALDYLQSQLNEYRPYLEYGWSLVGVSIHGVSDALSSLKVDWHGGLDYLQSQLNSYRPYLEYGWSLVGNSIYGVSGAIADLKINWHGALDYLQSQVNAYQPYISWGIYLVSQSVNELKGFTTSLADVWEASWGGINSSVQQRLNPILSAIGSVTSEWANMLSKLMQPISMPSIQLPDIKLPKIDLPDVSSIFDKVKGALTPDTVSGQPGRNLPIIGQLLQALDATGGFVEDSGVGNLLRSVLAAPGASLSGVGSALSGAGAQGAAALNKLKDLLSGLGGSIPAFATGAAVYGPTLAMVGDNPGARTDPEIVAPQSMIEEAVSGGSGDNQQVISMLERVEKAVKELKYIQAVIGQDTVGRASVNYINSENRRGNNPLLGL